MQNECEAIGWKQRLKRELFAYAINSAYLALFFSAFTWYRRLILAEYHITYLHYGAALIEALVLAKVILIGDALRIGRRFQHHPLIFSTLYRTTVFALWVVAFAVLEHAVIGILQGHTLLWGVHQILLSGRDELLGRALIVLLAFVPFFAFKEVGRVLGEDRMRELFLTRPVPAEHDSSA